MVPVEPSRPPAPAKRHLHAPRPDSPAIGQTNPWRRAVIFRSLAQFYQQKSFSRPGPRILAANQMPAKSTPDLIHKLSNSAHRKNALFSFCSFVLPGV
jgi:hypothetical protein